ncbi:MAG: tetratricopeptide repeat protein [Bacteroidia bacterium]|nr:tetratricopeptide repeat protein [Bacteroidia bacterium]
MALAFGDSSFAIAKSLERNDLLARSYNTIGKFYHLNGKYLLASKKFQDALEYATIANDEKLVLLATNALGISHLVAGNYDEAFKQFTEVEKSFRASGQEMQLASTLLNIGSLYKIKGEPIKAIECLVEALNIAESLSRQELTLKCLSGLGKIHEAMGQYEEALTYQKRALEIGEEQGYPGLIISCKLNIGQLYQQMEDYGSAEVWLSEALNLAKESDIPILAQTLTHALGKLAWKRNNHWDALQLLEAAEIMAEKLDNISSLLMIVAKDLSGLHQEMGNYPKALAYFRRYHDLMIAQSEELNSSRMQELELAFSLSQREREIEELNKARLLSRYRTMGLLLVISFSIIALLALYQRYRERQRSYAVLDDQHIKIQYQNKILQEQNQEIEEKNLLLAQKTKEIHKQNDALQLVNQELTHFARAASHDLREPLRAIKNYMDLLGSQYERKFDTRAREFLSMASAGAVRMEDLLNDLYQHARVGRSKEDFQLIDLNQMIKEVELDLRMTIEEKGASLIAEENMPVAFGIRTEIRMLLQNLVGNALKFSQPGLAPKVLVSASENSQHWVLEVKDQGIGIAPENQELIFGIFERLNPRDEYEGSGVGLATCQKIVQHHQGVIKVDSKLGFGTTFTVIIPKELGQHR